MLIGRDRDKIAAALEGSGVAIVNAETMRDAVRAGFSRAQAGDAVMLSPACASFDMFRNYEHRAKVFIDEVQALETLDLNGLLRVGVAAKPASMPEFDYVVISVAGLLLALGLIMVYSSSIAIAEGGRYTGNQATYYLVRHGIFLFLGIVAGFICFQFPLNLWEQAAPTCSAQVSPC